MEVEKLSKIISHALRHDPGYYNLRLSKDGWASISELVSGIKRRNIEYSDLNEENILKMVYSATKKRHEIKENKIRCLHGHSIEMEDYSLPLKPPTKLFHATTSKYRDKILNEGLNRMKRNYVHLSVSKQDAVEVAAKKYKDVILLQIDASKASEEGTLFYSNDRHLIWLCKHIPSRYISIIE